MIFLDFKSIKIKVFVVFLFFAILVGASSSLFLYFFAKDVLVQYQEKELKSFVVEQTRGTDQIFSASFSLVESIAMLPDLIDYLSVGGQFQDPEILAILERHNLGQNYSALYLLDASGLTLVSTDPTFVGVNYGFREYFQKAIIGEAHVEMSVGVTSKQPGFYFSAPVVLSTGEIIGVAVIKLKPEVVFESLESRQAEGRFMQKNIALVNRYGVVVFSNLEDWQYKSFADLEPAAIEEIETLRKFTGVTIGSLNLPMVQEAIVNYTAPSVIEFFDRFENLTRIFGVSGIQEFPFFIVVEADSEVLSYPALQIAEGLAGFSAVLAILVFLGVYIFIVRLLRPVLEIKETAEKITSGDLSLRVPVRGRDEFGRLGRAFNLMTNELQETYTGMEQIIKKQTKALSQRFQESEETKRALLSVLEDLDEAKRKIEADKIKDEAILDGIGEGVVAADSKRRILYINRAGAEIFGLKAEEVIGKKLTDCYSLEDEKGKIAPLEKRPSELIKGSSKTLNILDYTLVRKDKTRVPIMLTSTPFFQENKLVGIVTVFRDVTEERATDKAKSEFVSLASHQLRAPLTAVSWYVEMLMTENKKKKLFGKKNTEYLKRVSDGARSMSELIDAMLNASRLELKTFVSEPKINDLKKISHAVVNSLTPVIKKKKINFTEEYDRTLPKAILLDEKTIAMILQNLLSNAIKYTPAKGDVSFKIYKKQKDFVIEVKDTGIGIPAKQMKKIGTKMFRADNVKKVDTSGTGLGLYIVKTILEEVGGSLKFVSQEGKGSTFFVTLPLSGMKKQKIKEKVNFVA